MGQQIQVSFLEHKSFKREIKKFNKKHDGGIGYKSLQKLLEKHFHPINKEILLSPAVLIAVLRNSE